jgi:hypothetical protein
VRFELPTTGTSNTFAVFTSCNGFAMMAGPSIPVQVPVRCPTFDAIVIDSNPTNPAGSLAAVLPAQTATTIVVPAAMFKPMRNLAGMLTGLPGNASGRTLNASGWVTPTLPSSSRAFAAATPGANGMIGQLLAPMDSGLQNQLLLTYASPMPGVSLAQLVYDRIPATSTNVNRDYNSTLFQWAGNATFDIATRRLSWPFFAPTTTTPATPTFFAATVAYSHDANMGVIWRLVGDASRITTAVTTQSITYPDIPDLRTFEPISADVPSSDSIALFGVELAAERAMRQMLEPEAPDFGYFKIPTLRHVTVSIGQ